MTYWLFINYFLQVAALIVPFIILLLNVPVAPDHAPRAYVLNPDHHERETKATPQEIEAEREYLEEFFKLRSLTFYIEMGFLFYTTLFEIIVCVTKCFQYEWSNISFYLFAKIFAGTLRRLTQISHAYMAAELIVCGSKTSCIVGIILAVLLAMSMTRNIQ
jgi:hypothetical protein